MIWQSKTNFIIIYKKERNNPPVKKHWKDIRGIEMDFGKLFSIDNPVWKYLGRIWDAVWLTILWTVFSLPIVTIGASSTALCYVAQKIMRDEEGAVNRQFVAAFRANFKQATVIWLMMAVIGAVLGVNLWFYHQVDNSFGKTFMIVLLVFTYVFLMVLHYIFAVLARFDNSVKNLFALSFLFAVRNFGWTLMMITVTVCVAVIGVFVFAGLLLAGVGLAALVDAWILNHIFDQYIRDNHLGEENSEG